jgi:hypothetical protein
MVGSALFAQGHMRAVDVAQLTEEQRQRHDRACLVSDWRALQVSKPAPKKLAL